MNTTRILGVGFLSTALCLTGIACAVGGEKAAVKSVEPLSILAAMRTLETRPTLAAADVSSALGVTLTVDTQQSDDSFTYHVGKAAAGAGTAALDAVEVRMPGKGNTSAKGPFVYVTLKAGAGPTMDDVVAALGPATRVDAPRPNPEKALVLSYTTPRGELRFGIGTAATRPVVSATIDRTE